MIISTLRKIKFRKLIVVIFLTILIWVWADLAQDATHIVYNASVNISRTTNPTIWVSFDEKRSVTIDTIELKGPASKIDEAKRSLDDGSIVFAFTLDAEQMEMDSSGSHPLGVLNFLRESHLIKNLGLTVEDCEPGTLTVKVVGLAEKSLTVQCIDESGISQTPESIEPSRVEMFVPVDWGRDRLTAQVKLTEAEIIRARSAAIVKKPYIELPDGQIREAGENVSIKMPPEKDPLSTFTITTGTLGYCFSSNLQGRYKVEVNNLIELLSSITIRATSEAKQAYVDMRYQVILEIEDADKDREAPRREVVYNFPKKYVEAGEIKLDQQPVTAQFKLIRQPSADGP
jgi:hypothetical protein